MTIEKLARSAQEEFMAIHREIDSFRVEMRVEISDIRGELGGIHREIADIRAEMVTKNDFRQALQQMEERLMGAIGEIRDGFRDHEMRLCLLEKKVF